MSRLWAKNADATKVRQWTAESVRKRKHEQKSKPARILRAPFAEAFPDLEKLPLRVRLWAHAILLGLETAPVKRPLSAAERAAGRKVIDEVLRESGRVLPQQTKRQRLITRVKALRAMGKTKAVEIACGELGVPRATAFQWLRADSPGKSKKLD
jgi:hypothetical protein